MYLPFAILSTEHLKHNISVIRKAATNSQVMAMLKANAYGHGIRSTAMRLDNLVDFIGVARIDEAMALRKVGVKARICIMQGLYNQVDLIAAACNDFDLVVHTAEQLQLFDIATPQKINVWLKVDTGMGRLGFRVEEAMLVYHKLRSFKSIGTIILTSHFACAEEKEHKLNQIQLRKFRELAKDFPGPKSLANSAAIFNFAESHYDIVRPGLAIYGVSPIKGLELGLKPVMTLLATVMSVRDISAGTTIGYGARFKAKSDMKIATVAMGYGDGYPRTAVDGTPVLLQDKICSIVGRVSMDMITIDVTECAQVSCGNLVTFWGEQPALSHVAGFTQNSSYDILTSVQLRVKFNWTH